MNDCNEFQLHLAKKRVLGKQRFPFHDSVFLFDHSEVTSKPFHTVLDRIGGAYAAYFKQLPQDQLIERISQFSSRNLRTIVHDAELNIEHFNYFEYPEPFYDKCSSLLQLYSDSDEDIDIMKIGHSTFFMKYDVTGVESFPSVYQIEKEFQEIESIWREWGVNTNNEDHHDDDDDWNIVDGVHRNGIIVMEYFHGMGSTNNENAAEPICFICNRSINVGSHVAALLDTVNERRIICCKRRLFNPRNPQRKIGGNINILKEFHYFHFSCLVHWLLWNYCSTVCENPDLEYVDSIDEFFCPQCGRDVHGNQIYSEDQIAIVKDKIAAAKTAWTGSEISENSSIGLKFKNTSSEQADNSNTVHLWQTSGVKDKPVAAETASSTSSEESEQAAVKEISTFMVYRADYKAKEMAAKEESCK